ncbi:MAG: calcium/sodium antiporter [Roseibium sp.]|uniref:calcium/sodium antiporter n=1 Tax=Roseibium sp. TaxID=1936156 RepID=UPI00329691C6
MDNLTLYQQIILPLGAIAFGIYLLVKGGDWTIDSAAWVAEKSGLSKLFIAATIIAFGTSAPELFTSINANLSDKPGISLGNVLGSNIANILMVLGAAAIVSPLVVSRKEVRVDVLVMIAATAVLAYGLYEGIFSRLFGLAMLAGLIVYIGYQFVTNKLDVDDDEDEDDEGPAFKGRGHAALILLLGLVALVIGSELLVQGAIAGGMAIGVPEAVIGMTVIAFGTSLPELTTCITAARKGQYDMVIGGILGSNIFNILSIVAITSIIRPLVADPSFLIVDLPTVIVVTLLLSGLMLFSGKIGRATGAAFLAGYLAFIGFQYLGPDREPMVLEQAIFPENQ